MSEFQTISLFTEKDIVRIQLNREQKGNAVNLMMIREITQALIAVEDDSAIRFVIFSSKGNNFCTGADLEWMLYANRLSEDENLAECTELANMFYLIYNSSKITICNIDGACFGGGIGFVAACDYSIATTNAYYVFSEVKLGLLPAVISPYVLSRVNKPIVKNWMLTGKKISNNEALQEGLIDKLAENERPGDIEFSLIQIFRNYDQTALSGIKKLLNRVEPNKIDSDTVNQTARILAETRISEKSRKKITEFFIGRELYED